MMGRFGWCALVTGSLAACAARSESGVLGRRAPALSAQRVDGGTFHLSSLLGSVVVLDLWAEWCEGCEDELPALDELAARIFEVGGRVVSVSLDEDPKQALKILKARPWRMIALYDRTGRIGDAYAPEKLPVVFVIDRDGVVRDMRYALEPSDIAAIEERVRALATHEVNP